MISVSGAQNNGARGGQGGCPHILHPPIIVIIVIIVIIIILSWPSSSGGWLHILHPHHRHHHNHEIMFINIRRGKERQAASVWQNEWSCKSDSEAWMGLRSTKTSFMNHRDLDSLLECLGFRLFQYTQSTLTKLTNLKFWQLWIKS